MVGLPQRSAFFSSLLSDATRAFVGDEIVDLHFWNEHLPLLTDDSLRFARRMNERLHASLGELAAYFTASPQLNGIDVIRANMGFGTRGTDPAADTNFKLVRV